MAVEPTNESESAAAPQNPAPGPMLTDEDLESPSKRRKVACAEKRLPSVSTLVISPIISLHTIVWTAEMPLSSGSCSPPSFSLTPSRLSFG